MELDEQTPKRSLEEVHAYFAELRVELAELRASQEKHPTKYKQSRINILTQRLGAHVEPKDA